MQPSLSKLYLFLMDYRLENLPEDDFEKLINSCCQDFLGMGVVSFTKGKDGGRDGRFEGVANKYPSKNKPWQGKFIIQVKHTTDYQASCSDNTFFINKSSIINKEIPKIQKLKAANEIDNYLLFTNRKETDSREKAIQHIKKETDIQNVAIIGKNTLHRWLAKDSQLRKQFGLDKFSMPFEFYEKDIRAVITIFYETLPKIRQNVSLGIDRPDIIDKNSINQLDKSYYENIILSDLDRYGNKILTFINDDNNAEFLQYYKKTAWELKRVIETHREKFQDFKYVFDFLTKYLMEKEPEKLKEYRNVIPAFFHFMYYQCDIGREK